MTHDGVLVIDKPAGPTSHDVVEIVRRLLDNRRVGHIGTLDPFATGVLPLVLGKATRLAQFFSGDRKEYLATLLLGTRTNTFDLEGAIVDSRPVTVGREEIERALASMTGTFAQQPPTFSAKKIGGTRAHRLARAGTAVAPPPVEVTIFELEFRDFRSPELDIRLLTSGGFYVRAFADDLGRQLGPGACLRALRRTRSGPFSIADAISLERALKMPSEAASRVIPMAHLLPELPAATLTAEGVRLVAKGRAVGDADLLSPMSPLSPPSHVASAGRVRLVDRDGSLVAIAHPSGAHALHPSVVLI